MVVPQVVVAIARQRQISRPVSPVALMSGSYCQWRQVVCEGCHVKELRVDLQHQDEAVLVGCHGGDVAKLILGSIN